ncbi:unnamed protein product [Hermetia illucens]|uniref:Uncharacterized protein n=1 Tax=Hermetia illucens TaxID=343691 RepID=A0A7R8UVC7_HERIL|nr:unnamed protein product [Hermetia illucens]
MINRQNKKSEVSIYKNGVNTNVLVKTSEENEYEQMTADQIKIAKLEHTLTEVMAELRAARALNEKLSALIDNLKKRLEEKEMPVKTENNKRIRLEIPSASEDDNESPAEEEPFADSHSEEASSIDEDETDVQDDKTDDFPPLPPPKPVVQLPPPPKPTTKRKTGYEILLFGKMYGSPEKDLWVL